MLCMSWILVIQNEALALFPQIASVPHIVDVLANWDIQETEKLIARNETKRQERLKLEKEYIDRQTKLYVLVLIV